MTIMLLSITCSIAQVQIGFKVSPGLSINRVNSSDEPYQFEKNGSGVRFNIGPVLDFMINQNENYYFSTGLWYNVKRVGVNVDNLDEQYYNIQYLSLPVTVKLKTQEIALDKRIYLQFGPVFDVALNSTQKEGSDPFIEDFSFGDVGLLIGGGLEFFLGNSTRISTGISYSRGLVNVVNRTITDSPELTVKNDIVSLDLIVIF
jgi:hypothetical protein